VAIDFSKYASLEKLAMVSQAKLRNLMMTCSAQKNSGRRARLSKGHVAFLTRVLSKRQILQRDEIAYENSRLKG